MNINKKRITTMSLNQNIDRLQQPQPFHNTSMEIH